MMGFTQVFIGFWLVSVVYCCARTRSTAVTTVAPTTVSTTTVATTTTIPVCTTPANTAGITVDTGTPTVPPAGSAPTPTNHCNSCPSGTRNFYESADSDQPSDAIANDQVALTVNCPTTDLCMCNAAKVCCQPTSTNTAPDRIVIIPYCSGGTCQMNAVLSSGGAADAELMCTDGSMITIAMQYDMGNPQTLNSGGYFAVDSISCSGCGNIDEETCSGPVDPGPA